MFQLIQSLLKVSLVICPILDYRQRSQFILCTHTVHSQNHPTQLAACSRSPSTECNKPAFASPINARSALLPSLRSTCSTLSTRPCIHKQAPSAHAATAAPTQLISSGRPTCWFLRAESDQAAVCSPSAIPQAAKIDPQIWTFCSQR